MSETTSQPEINANVFLFQSNSALPVQPFYLVPILVLPKDSIVAQNALDVVHAKLPDEKMFNVDYKNITIGISTINNQFPLQVKQAGYHKLLGKFNDVNIVAKSKDGKQKTYSGSIKDLKGNHDFEDPAITGTTYELYQCRPFVICLTNYPNEDGTLAYFVGALVDVHADDTILNAYPGGNMIGVNCALGTSTDVVTVITPLYRITNLQTGIFTYYSLVANGGQIGPNPPVMIDYSNLITQSLNTNNSSNPIVL